MSHSFEHTYHVSDRFNVGINFEVLKNGISVSEDFLSNCLNNYLDLAKDQAKDLIIEEIEKGGFGINSSSETKFLMNVKSEGNGDTEEEVSFVAKWTILEKRAGLAKDAYHCVFSDLISVKKTAEVQATVTTTYFDEDNPENEDHEQAFIWSIDQIKREIENGDMSGSVDIEEDGFEYVVDWDAI